MNELNQQEPEPAGTRLLNSQIPLSEEQEMIRIISNRLFVALLTLLLIAVLVGVLIINSGNRIVGATNMVVFLSGAIGGFISLQRRLKSFEHEDLVLLARSWIYVLLSPLVGGILALLLFFLFIAGLLQGDLFPDFVDTTNAEGGLGTLFEVRGISHADYAKIIFWCFLAGFSESFVTNIISRFETSADQTT